MKTKWTIAIDEVIEYRLKKTGLFLSPMDNMYIDLELKVFHELLASLRLRVTNFGKFTKEVYG